MAQESGYSVIRLCGWRTVAPVAALVFAAMVLFQRIEDFALMKYFPIRERVRASLRFDFFNAFNRTQLQTPDTNSLDSTFGEITNLSSQISNRIGQATFRLEW